MMKLKDYLVMMFTSFMMYALKNGFKNV